MSNLSLHKSSLEVVDSTILSGEYLSDGVNLFGLRLFAIIIPSTWTAADITFQTSVDKGATWNNVYDSFDTETSAATGADRYIVLDPSIFASIQMIKIRSGISTSTVAQSGDRTVKLVLRGV